MVTPILVAGILAFELDRRFIDADLEIGMVGAPLLDLPGGLLEYPLADLDDQAGAFRNGDELAGADQPPARMLPADQRFRFVHLAGRQFHYRLVEQLELII